MHQNTRKCPNFSDLLLIFQHVAVDLSAPNEDVAEPETPTPNSPSHAAEAKHLGGPVPLIETENLSKPEATPSFPERLVIALAVQNWYKLHH